MSGRNTTKLWKCTTTVRSCPLKKSEASTVHCIQRWKRTAWSSWHQRPTTTLFRRSSWHAWREWQVLHTKGEDPGVIYSEFISLACSRYLEVYVIAANHSPPYKHLCPPPLPPPPLPFQFMPFRLIPDVPSPIFFKHIVRCDMNSCWC